MALLLLAAAGSAGAAVPATPTGLGVTPASGGRVVVTWTDRATDESGYYIERTPAFADGRVRVPADTTIFTDQPGQGTFSYTVTAYNADGLSMSAETKSIRVTSGSPGVHTGTPAPVEEEGSGSGGTGTVATGGSGGETGGGSGGESVLGGESDPGRGEGGNGNGNGGGGGSGGGGASAPQKPAGLRITAANSVELRWRDRSNNEDFFEIVRETYLGNSWLSRADFRAAANVEAFQDAPASGVYRYRVRASNAAGVSTYTDWVIGSISSGPSGGEVSTPPSAPSTTSVSDIGNGRAMVSWTDNSTTESGFLIERDPPFATGTISLSTNVSSYIDACENGTFSYRIAAFNIYGNSEYTPWASGTVTSGTGGGTGGTGGGTGGGGTGDPTGGGTGGSTGGGTGGSTGGGTGGSEWSVLAPSADTRMVYVSATGSDSNSGLSESEPKRTIAAGLQLIRNGYPDWLLLKRGDTFHETVAWHRSGRSATEPAVMTSYGTGPRPLILTGSSTAWSTWGSTPLDHVWVIGIHMKAETWAGQFPPGQDPSGICITRPGTDFLVEDCLIENFANNVIVQGYPGVRTDTRIRRNILADPLRLDPNNGSTNIYMAQYDGVLIEENLLDNSRASEAAGAMLSHNIYLGENNPPNNIIRGNIAHNGGRTNFNIRSGGLIENNVSIRGAQGFTVGVNYAAGITTANLRDNVIIETRNNSNGQGLGFGFSLVKVDGTTIENNILAHGTDGTYHLGILLSEQCSNMTIAGNVIYRWMDPGSMSSGVESIACSSTVGGTNVLRANEIQQPTNSSMMRVTPPCTWTALDNKYYSQRSPASWFTLGSQQVSLEGWRAATNETGVAQQISYPDPERTVTSYASTIGLTASTEAFLNAARTQSRDNWHVEYTADALNDYIRAGFGKTQSQAGQ